MAVEGTEILRGVDLVVGAGEVHALMGPNGAGKSTLAATLLGHPAYQVTDGSIRFLGEDVTHWATDARAKAGLFLAFQYPESIEGVSVAQFLRQAMSARKGEDLSVLEVRFAMTEWMERLGMDPAFAERHLNQGFSGGEKKRNEILQMALLEPRLAVLDETDSGLDIDALRVVGRGVHTVREAHPELGVLVVTHYQRLLEDLVPDQVHLLVDGRVVESGGPELSRRIETGGYESWRAEVATSAGRRAPGRASTWRCCARTSPSSAHGARPPRRLPRLGRHLAAAAAGPGGDGPLLRDHPRQRPPRRLRHRRGGHPPLRARPDGRRPLHRGPGPRPRDRLHQERHRGHQPGGPLLGPGQARRATWCCSPRWSTTPTWSPG